MRNLRAVAVTLGALIVLPATGLAQFALQIEPVSRSRTASLSEEIDVVIRKVGSGVERASIPVMLESAMGMKDASARCDAAYRRCRLTLPRAGGQATVLFGYWEDRNGPAIDARVAFHDCLVGRPNLAPIKDSNGKLLLDYEFAGRCRIRGRLRVQSPDDLPVSGGRLAREGFTAGRVLLFQRAALRAAVPRPRGPGLKGALRPKSIPVIGDTREIASRVQVPAAWRDVQFPGFSARIDELSSGEPPIQPGRGGVLVQLGYQGMALHGDQREDIHEVLSTRWEAPSMKPMIDPRPDCVRGVTSTYDTGLGAKLARLEGGSGPKGVAGLDCMRAFLSNAATELTAFRVTFVDIQVDVDPGSQSVADFHPLKKGNLLDFAVWTQLEQQP